VSNFVFPTCSWSSLFGWSLSLCLSTCPMLIIYLFSVSVSSQFVGVRHNSPKLGPQRLKIWIKLCKSMSNYIHITKISHTLEKHIQKKKPSPNVGFMGEIPSFHGSMMLKSQFCRWNPVNSPWIIPFFSWLNWVYHAQPKFLEKNNVKFQFLMVKSLFWWWNSHFWW
jgi:hypothetical protein